SHAPHVGGKLVDLVEAGSLVAVELHRFAAASEIAQVEQPELVCCRRAELRLLDVDAAYPVAVGLQTLHEVPGDESARAAYQRSLHDNLGPRSAGGRSTYLRSKLAAR